MGIDINHSRFLMHSFRTGVDFSRTITLGRQHMNISATDLQRNIAEFGFPSPRAEELLTGEGYAEPFLRMLGAQQVDSLDISRYEGATHLHDLNLPMDRKFFGRYSVVLDGGTLEHIFNTFQAFSDCMRMVRVGGYFLAYSPMNNFPGHGMYQFSPELFFRVFCKENGFTLCELLQSEGDLLGWWKVMDPKDVGWRVGMPTPYESSLFAIARKVQEVPLFSVSPQQNDYIMMWKEYDSKGKEAVQPI
jgi:hypothetical protein